MRGATGAILSPREAARGFHVWSNGVIVESSGLIRHPVQLLKKLATLESWDLKGKKRL